MLAYLHLSWLGLGWDIAVIVAGDLGLGLAKVLTGRVESGLRHSGCTWDCQWCEKLCGISSILFRVYSTIRYGKNIAGVRWSKRVYAHINPSDVNAG